ncbi:hypothetical protein EC991_009115 [Linnemannia zychae]|nr:hypothetical protein EC991_009115 [Linnemannia zychae]
MLLKSTLLLSLAAYASAVTVAFWQDSYRKGKVVSCDVEIDTCYRIPAEIRNIGLSSLAFRNHDWTKKSWTVLLSAGDGSNCAGTYDSWGFEQSVFNDPTNIDWFPTVNDKVYSFKVYNHMSDHTFGGFKSQAEHSSIPSCKIF